MSYLALLGLRFEARDGRALGVMPFQEHLIGNPTIPALHGGTVAGLLESTAHHVAGPGARTVTLTVEYLRSGKQRDTYATAKVLKAGRRVTTLFVLAFQEDEAQPIASATVVLTREWSRGEGESATEGDVAGPPTTVLRGDGLRDDGE